MEIILLPISVAIVFLFLFFIERKHSRALDNKLKEVKSELFVARMDFKKEEKKHQDEVAVLKGENTDLRKMYERKSTELANHQNSLERLLKDNLKHFPFLAGQIADYLTYDIEILAKKLDWGANIEREKKVIAIREIRRETKAAIREARIAQYELEYLIQLYPELDDVLNTEYRETEIRLNLSEEDRDPTLNYLTLSEWKNLSPAEKNQLALERYIESTQKSKWQIGRDYELSVGYRFQKAGYNVDYFGSNKKLEDLGRDLIAKKGEQTIIVQCKYWSQKKTIHEKHVFNLYGTVICYCIENNIKAKECVRGVFITNIKLSGKAREVAEMLGIKIVEELPMADFPRIKCNINKDEYGIETKIYHLPMDQQYDSVKIDKKGELLATTVYEAEMLGFRRAFKWHGQS